MSTGLPDFSPAMLGPAAIGRSSRYPFEPKETTA